MAEGHGAREGARRRAVVSRRWRAVEEARYEGKGEFEDVVKAQGWVSGLERAREMALKCEGTICRERRLLTLQTHPHAPTHVHTPRVAPVAS